MISSIANYYTNLNNAGQALFIVGVLLIITFIILLIIVLKPEKKVKKIYGESEVSDRENVFEEKMKDIDNVSSDDINLDNDKTRNLKNIVDELKHIEQKNNNSVLDEIERYEDDQENTAIISVEELLRSNKKVTYEKRPREKVVETVRRAESMTKMDDDFVILDEEDTKEIKIIGTLDTIKKDDNKRREVFSSVYTNEKNDNNEQFLNSLKQFRNNL